MHKGILTLIGVLVLFSLRGQVQKGTDIIGENEYFGLGRSLSLSANGQTLAAGAFYSLDSPVLPGYVRVYDWDDNNWVQRGKDLKGDDVYDLFGAAVSLSADGNTIAVGVPYHVIQRFHPGLVRIFIWDGNNWVQRGNDLIGEAMWDKFGFSLSISEDGNTVVISGQNNDGNGDAAGHIRVYDWVHTDWVQRGEDIDGDQEYERFGLSVDISNDGNTVIAGGPNYNGLYANGDMLKSTIGMEVNGFKRAQVLSQRKPMRLLDGRYQFPEMEIHSCWSTQ